MKKYYFPVFTGFGGIFLFILIEPFAGIVSNGVLLFSIPDLLVLILFFPMTIMMAGFNFRINEGFITGYILMIKVRKIYISEITKVQIIDSITLKMNKIAIGKEDKINGTNIPYSDKNELFLAELKRLKKDISFSRL